MDLNALDLVAAAQAVRSRQVSSRELVHHVHGVADRHDPALGVFLRRFRAESLAAADAADRALAAGEVVGPLHGVPIGVKDMLGTREGPTTAQSPAMAPEWGREDAAVVTRLRAAGAIVIGKTSTMEFAYAAPDPTHPYPIPANPWDAHRWPGGSSSGSAAGVAARMMWAAVGTDTGGSVRVPAAMCGITGLKPTTGRVTTRGCVPLSYSMDTVGPMAYTARDCALLFQVMTGSTGAAPTAATIRVGVVDLAEPEVVGHDPVVHDAFDAAADVLRAGGATTSAVELPLYPEVMTAHQITISTERLSWHRRRVGSHWSKYGTDARTGLARAIDYSAVDYLQAQRVRRRAQELVAELFTRVDVIISPVCLRTSPLRTEIADCMRTWPELVLTRYWNVLGNPAVSVPMGAGGDGLPIGLQIIGRPGADEFVLQVAEAYQVATGWHRLRPDLTRLPNTAVPVAPVAPASDSVIPEEQVAIARDLAHRGGLTAASDAEIRAMAAGWQASRAQVAALHRVDCGDGGPALELTYP